MESLNKQQLILLALLVSFVTSIATGIVTVSLLDQAPPGVTQTINRVVERTIEKAVTVPNQAAAVVTKETVVVKADDLVIDAIAKNTRSIVRIREITGEGEGKKETFAGLGLIATKDGFIVSDLSIVYRKDDESGNPIPESYIGVFPDGRTFSLNITLSDQDSGLLVFQAVLPDAEKTTYAFTPPRFASAELKLGQAVVSIGGDDSNAVSTGIISNLIERSVPPVQGSTSATSTESSDKAAQKILSAVKTDIRSPDQVLGSVLLNLSGEVIGMSAGKVSTTRTVFVPIQKILTVVAKATAVKVADVTPSSN